MKGHFFQLTLLCLALMAGAVRGQSQPPLLTRIDEVRALSVTEARQNREARLRGIVVYIERYGIIFQDETGSTFFRPTEQQMALQVGDEIEVSGRTQAGRFIGGLGPSEVRVIRRGQPPPTITATHDDVISARYFYQRVAVEGIVRSVDVKQDWTSLRLAKGASIVEVRIAQQPPPGLQLVDAKVSVKGLSAGSINDLRQVVETFIRMQSWDEIEVIEPPVEDREVPQVAARELLAFRPSGRPERRVAVSGTLTAVFPDGEIYLEDQGVAFGAYLNRTTTLSVGDRVELVGYVGVLQFSASVVDAQVRRREAGAAPQPVAVASPDLLSSAHDTRLVAVEGHIADAFKSINGYTLVLSGQKRAVQISVPGEEAPPPTGSRARVVGICHVEILPSPEFVRRAGSIQLQARSAADVTVLEAPRWWTTRRLVVALLVLVGAILAAGIWNVVLHRRVRAKTAALRESIESEAALEERQRIAQEFHDTLEQDLTGLGLRLDAAETRMRDESGRHIMATSRHLLTRIQAETKNIVSNLRDTAPLGTDLAETLESLVRNYTGLEGVEVRAEMEAGLPRLPGNTLHHLHMMTRESVNNALKHARASLITVRAAWDAGRLRLTVTDDGRGFDVDRETKGKSGHFGCIGIRERARKIGATVVWRSEAGHGTTVDIFLSVKSADATAGRPQPDASGDVASVTT